MSAPRSSSQTDNHDATHHFLMESHHIATEAQFIIDSLPNAENAAVEWIVCQLKAIHTILLSLDDVATSQEKSVQLVAYVNHLLTPLEAYLSTPPQPANLNVPSNYTRSRGRPPFILDLERAQELHNLGNSWESQGRPYIHIWQLTACLPLGEISQKFLMMNWMN